MLGCMRVGDPRPPLKDKGLGDPSASTRASCHLTRGGRFRASPQGALCPLGMTTFCPKRIIHRGHMGALERGWSHLQRKHKHPANGYAAHVHTLVPMCTLQAQHPVQPKGRDMLHGAGWDTPTNFRPSKAIHVLNK